MFCVPAEGTENTQVRCPVSELLFTLNRPRYAENTQWQNRRVRSPAALQPRRGRRRTDPSRHPTSSWLVVAEHPLDSQYRRALRDRERRSRMTHLVWGRALQPSFGGRDVPPVSTHIPYPQDAPAGRGEYLVLAAPAPLDLKPAPRYSSSWLIADRANVFRGDRVDVIDSEPCLAACDMSRLFAAPSRGPTPGRDEVRKGFTQGR